MCFTLHLISSILQSISLQYILKSRNNLCKHFTFILGNTTNFAFHLDHEHPETLTPSGADVPVQTLCQTTTQEKCPHV